MLKRTLSSLLLCVYLIVKSTSIFFIGPFCHPKGSKD